MSQGTALLVAHHCNPEWGSEPLIGWRWASELAEGGGTELITHIRNRGAIERAGGLPCKVHYVDTEATAAFIDRLNSRLWRGASPVNRLALEAVAQIAFDRRACRIARRRIESGAVDLIHRVSPISPRFPTRLGTLGVPLVLGPVNGGMTTMPGFAGVSRQEKEGFLRVRSLSRLLDVRHRTLASASRILVATEGTRAALPPSFRDSAVHMPENGVKLSAFPPAFGRQSTQLRALYLGRLLPYKGVDVAIRALSAVRKKVSVSLDVIGDGPERGTLEQLARELGLEDSVHFHGAVPVDQVSDWMRSCDAYVFPSVRESGGATVMEAMASGKPVIVANHGGPAETVRPGTGFRVDARSPAELVQGVAEALEAFARHEGMRARMARAARFHVETQLTWGAKIERARRIYEEVRSNSDSNAGVHSVSEHRSGVSAS